MISFIFVALSVTPPLLWLAYYLHQDNHPEPKPLVVLAFIMGMALTLPAIGLQIFVSNLTHQTLFPSLARIIGIGTIFWITMAFIEELLKYLGMRWTAYPHRHFHQPIDAMVYMIVVGLGFAAAENLFFAFGLGATPDALNAAVAMGIVRGLSATLLHAVTAGVTGYFVARSLAFDHRHHWTVLWGLLTATALHVLYNFLILIGGTLSSIIETIMVIVLLVASAGIVSMMIRQLEQFASFQEEHRSEHTDTLPLTPLE